VASDGISGVSGSSVRELVCLKMKEKEVGKVWLYELHIYIHEDSNLHTHRRENLKSYIYIHVSNAFFTVLHMH
jgi:hypothetical protein